MRKFILLFFILLTTLLSAQDDPMQVIRCDAVNRQSAIINIYVDDENVKWIANGEGLFKVYDLSYAEPARLSSLDQSLISIPGGNANLFWNKDELNEVLNNVLTNDNVLTAATYNAGKDELWLGTSESGAFKLKTQPSLRLLEEFNDRTSKLKSNYVNTIYLDTLGREWIATKEGVLVGKNGKWELLERYFDILSVAVGPSGDWLLTSDYFGNLDRKDTWYPIELPPRSTEGRLTDMIFDKNGLLWVASDVITSYNPKTEKVNVYGPAQYYTSEFATAMAADRDDGIWVATEDKGLFLIQKASNMTVTAKLEKELSCNAQGEDAVISARVVGGAPPYQYQWSNGNTTDRLENIGAGAYELTVTDSRGNQKISKVDIPDPNVTANTGMDQPESAPGAADGAATVTAGGGSGTYSYRWDNGETGAQAAALSEGIHQVTVTDENGCSAVTEVNISRAVQPLVAAINPIKELDCPGGSNAELAVQIEGGKPPFAYQWSTGATEASVNNLPQGSYSLTITDGEGNTAKADYTIAPGKGLELQIQVVAPASTGLSDGQASVEVVSGGVAPFTFKWDNGETQANATTLPPGDHTVTVTDQNGCSSTATVNISEDILPLTAAIQTVQQIDCNGEANGSLKVNAQGGKGPYQYQWSANDQNGAEASGLAAGNYSVTITDIQGAKVTASYQLEQPDAIQAQISVLQPAGVGQTNGQAQVEVTGGNGSLSYTWDNGEITPTAKRLGPGVHSVTITDQNDCQTIAEVQITENILPLTATIEQTEQIECNGQATAGLRAVVNGGKGPFQYQWNHNNHTENTLSELPAGNYSVRITDVEGTTTTASFVIEEPDALTAKAIADGPASTNNEDGQATATASGGSGNYTFQWDNGETGAQATKLAPGLHTVTIKDDKGCITTAEVNITENILPLVANVEQTGTIECFGASTAAIQASVSGGKGPFTFQWDHNSATTAELTQLPAGAYTVSITDSEGTVAQAQFNVQQPDQLKATATAIDPASTDNQDGKAAVKALGGTGNYSYAWDNGETTQQANQLAPGVHTVTVTDRNGCTTTAEVNITENILPLVANVEQTGTIECFGASTAAIQASVSGGKGPFTFQWDHNSATTAELTQLPAGAYTVSITDSEGTVAQAQFNVQQPDQLKATATAIDPASTDNQDGKAAVKALGGTGNYSYAWDNGETTQQANQLAPGMHTVTVTDRNGCTTTAEVNITENILPLVATIEQTATITCFGEPTAALKVNRSGGKGPFRLEWAGAEQQGEALTGLAAGTYQLTVTDAVNNSAITSITIEQPNAIEVSLTAAEPASTDNEDGQATVQAKGGSGNYTYAWENGETKAQATQLAPGAHTVTVTDDKGCSATFEVEIGENILPLTADIEQTATIQCFGDATAALKVNRQGGKGPFQFQWNKPELSGNTADKLAAGEYAVTISDAAGNSTTAQVNIRQPEQLTAAMAGIEPASTDNEDGKAGVKVSGGAGGYAFAWDNGETTQQAQRLTPGVHTVTVTDQNGCTTTAEMEITENILPLTAAIEQAAEIQCFGDATAALQVNIQGGKGPFQFQWSKSELSGNTADKLAAGEYAVTISDAVGNSTTTQITIRQPDELTTAMTGIEPASTDNEDGKAGVQVSGGAGGYAFAWDNGETTQRVQKLAPGMHSVTVTDQNGCTTTAEVEITENILPLAANINIANPVLCYGQTSGALTVRLDGGKGPFEYQWNDPALSGNQIDQLAAGEYAVTITDAIGQTATASVMLDQPSPMDINTQFLQAARDETTADGKAMVEFSGGTPGYAVSWDNGESTATASRLAYGKHIVSITDNNGCVDTASVFVEKRKIPELVVEEVEEGQKIRIEALNFQADSTNIEARYYPVLDELHTFLTENTSVAIEIGGHTNSLPPDWYCDELSTARAKSIADYLIALGIAKWRVIHKGYGKRFPIASNDTEEGRRQNQRIEITILSLGNK